MTPPPMSMLPVMENTMATKICSRSRAIAVVLLILALADIGRGRSDREVTALARFSREHKGALLWYDASDHFLVTNAGQVIDAIRHVAAFAHPPNRSYPSLSPDEKRVAFVQEQSPSED